MISHLGDPTLNRSSEWLCKVCGHSEFVHNLALGTCETTDIKCPCDGFEDEE